MLRLKGRKMIHWIVMGEGDDREVMERNYYERHVVECVVRPYLGKKYNREFFPDAIKLEFYFV